MLTDADLEVAARILRGGGLVAFPTETVYGLGADASQAGAVQRVFTVKGRPAGHPLIVHLSSIQHLDDWAAGVPDGARALAEAFWPGPLTLLLERSTIVADVVTGGRSTVGLRVPAHPVALGLLEAFGGGVAAPSANRFGRVSPTTAAHVVADLGDEVDMVLDGGPCTVGIESTIVDFSEGRAEVVRVGGITGDQLAEVLGGPVATWRGGRGSREVAAPGTLASHYAPDARIELATFVDAADVASRHLEGGARVGVLAPEPVGGLPTDVVQMAPAGPPERYARVLYERLREADALGLDVVVAVPPPPVGIGVAVADRLQRAAAASPGRG